ncbi:sigma-54 interaction domain-containing protein [Oceanobacillus bengalensis]|uniref:PAS domain-containing protein n=1 Tax=Oceanobacillus bengalensis TaxID=1435466 RepID=A0A494YXH7_9BACI|nr:sigma 54-interacting transcriptional regulator [Oceanobacillus bengalensis]RKQ14931.1 PAS domain-containing protein [Oceanobacillus bengalensis]
MDKELAYLHAVLSAEDDAITIVNPNEKVMFWNNAAVETYNIPQSIIIGKKITDFFHNDDLMVLKVLHTKEPVKNTYHRPRRDKHVVINALPIYDENNCLLGAVSAERDITKIVKLNESLTTTSTELNELRQKVYSSKEETPFSKLKGNSAALHQTIDIARKAAKTSATTLILGESGTGKEICARAIHETSKRNLSPFIPVNCGAIPSALFESELFGYEGGAFTGAEKKGKAGKIEMADGGTIFLDEVGELPLEMQVKLLRVLQENVLYRIGDSTGKKINVRFIAATNQNLEQLMEEKKFRSDLYYRLNVIQVKMPPLRNRLEDIPELTQVFLNQYAAQYQVPLPRIEEGAMEELMHYHWPGNIRELRNLIQRIVILTESPIINQNNLLDFFHNEISTPYQPEKKASFSLPQEKEAMEKQLIEETLIKMNGNKSKAAKILGISRVTLYNKMKKFRI